ncbi:MAG: hypothetical protein GY856_00095 [bacterium]|nr:hypothetical protein [bacterium]
MSQPRRGESAGGEGPGEQEPQPGQVRALAWNPTGAFLAASSGPEVLLWEVGEADREPRRLSAESGVLSVAWSSDGRFLAAGTAQGPIMLWEPERPGPPITLLGHTTRVGEVAFHPRRNRLVSGSVDGSLRLWDVRHPDALPLVLEGHEDRVWAAAFSQDGERLISGSGDGIIYVRTTSSEALAREICRTVTRNLTPEEWDRYLPPEVEYEKTCPHMPGAPAP